MESYIVRIYRRDGGDAIAGVMEDTLSHQTVVFRSIAELSKWLRTPPHAAQSPSPSKGP
jgi:hypothetical protein